MTRRAEVYKGRSDGMWRVLHESKDEDAPYFTTDHATWDEAIAGAIYWTGI